MRSISSPTQRLPNCSAAISVVGVPTNALSVGEEEQEFIATIQDIPVKDWPRSLLIPDHHINESIAEMMQVLDNRSFVRAKHLQIDDHYF